MKTSAIQKVISIVCLGMIMPLAAWAQATLAAGGATACSVPKGGMTTIEIPFEVKGISIADKTVIRIESDTPRKLRIVGLKEGTTGVQVSGDGNLSAQYDVSVMADIAAILGSVRKLLEEVPGVEATLDAPSGKIFTRGDVMSLDHWNHLQKVVALFSPQVVNFAKFNLTPDIKLRLMDAFEKSGLKAVEPGAPDAGTPGVLTLQMSHNNLMVSGTVLNSNELVRIDQVLSAMNWIIVKPGGSKADDLNEKVTAIVDVTLDTTLIEVGVAFVGMTDKEFSQRTGNLLSAGLMTVSDTSLALQGGFGRGQGTADGANSRILKGGQMGNYNVSSGMGGALKLLSGNEVSRAEKIGHLTLQNNAAGASFRDGGTIKARVSGLNSADLKDIPYGIEVKADGYLKDPSTVALRLNTSVSLPRLQPNGDYDVNEQKLENFPVTCKLGQTLILAGSKQTQEQLGRQGVPLLRQIPVINWFTSDKTSGHEEMRLLILVSPQLAASSQPGKPMSDQTRGLLDDTKKPLR